jgi:hypothetical protein
MNFDFGNVLTRAWQIIWKHKILWIFGILAGCTRGGGGGGGGGSGGGGGGRNGGDPLPPEMQQAFENTGDWITDNGWIIVVVVVLLIALWLLFVFLGTIGRIGLIRGTVQAEGGAASLSFGELFSGSLPYFWRVFGLALLIGLAFLVIFIPIILLGVLTAGVGFVCVLPLLCVLVPVAWAVNVILEQANVAIVTENVGLLAGLQRGWEVVKGNVGPILVMALILAVLSFAVGLVIAVPIFVIVFPAMFAFILGQGESYTPLLVAGLCFVAYLPISITLGGILTAYIGSAWTLTYTRLARPAQGSPTPVPVDA